MAKLKENVRKVLSTVSPTLLSKILYQSSFHKKLNLQNPQTFNEKLMWLKLNTYNKNPLITQCADKYRVRDYLVKLGYGDLLIPLIDSWEKVEDINWDELPNKFVLKCNHGAGYNLICKDKSTFNVGEAVETLNKWLKEDYWKKRAELNYKYVEKRITCEAFIETKTDSLIDYKFYCINGQVDSVMVCLERERGKPTFYFYDENWSPLLYTPDSMKKPSHRLERPAGIDEAFKYAQALAKPFPFVRIDFYIVDGKVIFGEFTFTPGAALYSTILPETDALFGKKMKLPS